MRLQLNYEEAVGRVNYVANVVVGLHLALIVLDVSVLASSLPNVYVSDPGANCGARYLAGYASHYILQSGLMVILAALISSVYWGWITLKKLTNTVIGYTGQGFYYATFCALGIPSLFFFISAGSQLTRLGNPPKLPDNFQTTHVCPALPYLP